MPVVWRIGSRWSGNGAYESRIYRVFRRNGIVFIGSDQAARMSESVHAGHYFAVADGLRIIAVAKAIDEPEDLQQLIDDGKVKIKKGNRLRKQDYFTLDDDYGGWCCAVRVKFVDLDKDQCFDCYPCQSFCRVNDREVAERVVRYFENGQDKKFDIAARTYRVFNTRNIDDGKESVINDRFTYVIPIYQREYSWNEAQIVPFVTDIFNGFWGTEDVHELSMDPMFIGTMQLSEKNRDLECNVIDGQQRLSTILCILKYLKLRYPEDMRLEEIPIDWLETRVNNEKEQAFLEELLDLTSLEKIAVSPNINQNSYLRNLGTIAETFESITKDEEGNVDPFFTEHFQEFLEYLLNDIYFVVVETKAGLSKTLKIFNTINTAGLDLGANDLFKIRMYEYLRDVKGRGESSFEEISKVYRRIKDINADWQSRYGWELLDLDGTLRIYKNYIIAKFKLPTELFSMATDTFFECLFDIILKVREHKEKGFGKVDKVDLSLEDLNRIIDIQCFWNGCEFDTKEQFISYSMIEWTRYARHNNIAYLILLRNDCNGTDSERLEKVNQFLTHYSRFLFCAHIDAARKVSWVETAAYGFYKSMMHDDWETILENVRTQERQWYSGWLKHNLSKNIMEKKPWANAICRVSAYLDEIEADPGISIQDLTKKLEYGFYDLEHIHAVNDMDFDFEDYDLLNSIGNLMLLEGHINKSIGNLPFAEKKDRSDGNDCYKDSCYACVAKISRHEHWTEADAAQRRETEVNRIIEFLTHEE